MRLKNRIKNLEETLEPEAARVILVKFPEKPEFSCGNRTFPNVEAAVTTIEKERGCKVEPIVFRVVYDSPEKQEVI